MYSLYIKLCYMQNVFLIYFEFLLKLFYEKEMKNSSKL